MILLADIGNTRIKWALLEGGRFTSEGAAVWRGQEPRALLDQLWGSQPRPARVLISTVVRQGMAEVLQRWLERCWSLEPEFARVGRSAHGVTNAYEVPERLGVDRWLALLAAKRHYPGASCIVDCGTAVTVDVLTSAGEHLGGLIAPGLALMRRSLAEGTEALGAQATPHVGLLARDTQDAITAGSCQALAGFIERVAGGLSSVLAEPCRNILTGGDAQLIAPLLSVPVELDPYLVLRGLAIVAEESE